MLQYTSVIEIWKLIDKNSNLVCSLVHTKSNCLKTILCTQNNITKSDQISKFPRSNMESRLNQSQPTGLHQNKLDPLVSNVTNQSQHFKASDWWHTYMSMYIKTPSISKVFAFPISWIGHTSHTTNQHSSILCTTRYSNEQTSRSSKHSKKLYIKYKTQNSQLFDQSSLTFVRLATS